jgi:hypothetical protein
MSLDRKKFTQICGMLGSEFAGERANAAEAATRMLQAAGLTWAELLKDLFAGRQTSALRQSAAEDLLRSTGKGFASCYCDPWRANELIHAVRRAGFVRSVWDREFLDALL